MSAPRLVALEVGDEPDAWRDAGFTVDDRATTHIGEVAVGLVGGGGGIRRLALTGVDLAALDGLGLMPAGEVSGSDAAHANGVRRIDHVVLLTPDHERTIGAFGAVGLDVRRVRHTDQYGPPFRQVFFRAGKVILEVIGPDEPDGSDRPARAHGLAFTCADLDATAAFLGDRLGAVEDAVQPGRRIATLRRAVTGITIPLAFMSPPT